MVILTGLAFMATVQQKKIITVWNEKDSFDIYIQDILHVFSSSLH